MAGSAPVLWMRGGTSKGGYFLASDLPADTAARDAFLLAVMGSPDPRQIDGMGGADPLTSKVAVVKKSERPGIDVDYLFLQVFVDQAIVTDAQNCGNILAGVGPFAIERGLVAAQDGETPVAIYMENTGQVAVAKVQTPGGVVTYAGEARIDGVPGTHAIGLGVQIVEAVLNGEPFTLPRFDKSIDDRAPQGRRIEGKVDVLLIEGWCVGARPQSPEALATPVNALEAEEDRDGIWRGVVNMLLAAGYAQFFGFIDVLVMLKVESFEAVFANRQRQERKLAERHPDAPGLMDDAALARFIQHYERLTRHMLAEMPGRADLVFAIGPDQAPLALPDGLGPVPPVHDEA